MIAGSKAFIIVGVILLLIIILGIVVYSWGSTPHGRLDWRLGIILKISEWLKIDLFEEGRTIAEVREFARTSNEMFKAKPTELPEVKDIEIPGPAAAIRARVYMPEGDYPLPVIIYFHGGGWVIGNLDSHDNVCRDLAAMVPAVVLSVDYRLAPEHVFPAALEDAFTALEWTAQNAAAINGDPTRIAVAGDSAGANLAAVLSMLALDNGPDLSAQVLIYPAVDMTNFDTESHRLFRDGYYLTRDYMVKFRDLYLPNEADWGDQRVSPLLYEVPPNLPPALVLTAHFDPLRDEGEAYATLLHDAGVSIELIRYSNMIHGFITMDRLLPAAKRAREDCAQFLSRIWYEDQ